MIISGIILHDVWKFHRSVSSGLLEAEWNSKDNQNAVLKLSVAIAFIIGSLVALITTYELRTRFTIIGVSDALWNATSCILSIIWTIDIAKYHLKTKTTNLPDSTVSSNDRQNEGNLEDHKQISLE